MSTVITFIKKYYVGIILLFLLLIHIYLRFSQIEQKNIFGWDQVDNAWAVVDILVHHKFPLLGMVAKGNSGIYIGPAYYYLVAIPYFFTNLDPIASGIFAGMTSIIEFFVIFFVCKKLFSTHVALIAVFLNTILASNIYFDRVQWPVDFIPMISLGIFYCLYKILRGNPKYIIWLAMLTGFSFHIHFTSLFFPIIILLSLPFFPKRKETLIYTLVAIPLFLIWFAPIVIAQLQLKHSYGANFLKYSGTYYHGFHLTRFLQLAKDGLIEFDHFLQNQYTGFLKYILIPLFGIIYYKSTPQKKDWQMIYLVILWFLIPWIVFTTYSGEISDYYFSSSRYIVLCIMAYFLYRVLIFKNIYLKGLLIFLLLWFSWYNLQKFTLISVAPTLTERKVRVKVAVQGGQKMEFFQGDPDSYLYYIYSRNKNGK